MIYHRHKTVNKLTLHLRQLHYPKSNRSRCYAVKWRKQTVHVAHRPIHLGPITDFFRKKCHHPQIHPCRFNQQICTWCEMRSGWSSQVGFEHRIRFHRAPFTRLIFGRIFLIPPINLGPVDMRKEPLSTVHATGLKMKDMACTTGRVNEILNTRLKFLPDQNLSMCLETSQTVQEPSRSWRRGFGIVSINPTQPG